MNKIEKYYENTKNCLAHKNVINFIRNTDTIGNAIDIGCGAGRDTVYLIKNGWNVLAIDKENVKILIEEQLNSEELKRFKFSCQTFENIELEKNDLIISNFAIPFCNKNYFQDFWNKIVNSISINRIFCW